MTLVHIVLFEFKASVEMEVIHDVRDYILFSFLLIAG